MELNNYLTTAFLYELARGPMVWISCLVFAGGIVFQVYRYLSLTDEVETATFNIKPSSKRPDYKLFSYESLLWFRERLKQTIIGVNPGTLCVSIVFHIFIFVIPLFLLGHNILIKNTIGFSLFSFSEKMSDSLTLIFLVCVLFFLTRRIFTKRVRSITSIGDYLMLIITATPFLTGYMAFHQIYDYRTIMVIHMLSGELMLAVIPFTKLVHMIVFFIFRFKVASEYSMGRGNRTW